MKKCSLVVFLACSSFVITDAAVPRPDLASGGGATVPAGELGDAVPDEQRLIEAVFADYDPGVRPVFNSSDNVVVKFGFTLVQIMDLEEKNQVLVTNAWLEHSRKPQIWRDERIAWDPDDYNGLSLLRIPAALIWLPDIVLYNNADDFTSGYMLGNIMVDHLGMVSWPPPARLRSSCKIDITYFPFDTQQCSLKFGSWTYDKAQVDIVNKTHNIDVSSYVSNGEWQLLGYSVVRKETVYPAVIDSIYPDVTITVVIRRRVLYYVLNILFPCIWLSVLSILTFCLPPDEGEKVTLGITVLLSYSVFMLLIAEKMPPTSEFVPLIGMYLTVVMATTCISIFLTVLVLKLYHQSPYQTPVPHWVRVIVLQWIASVVQCRCMTRPAPNGLKWLRQILCDCLPKVTARKTSSSRDVSHPDQSSRVTTEMSSFIDDNSTATVVDAENVSKPESRVIKRNDHDSKREERNKSPRSRHNEDIADYIKLLVAKSDAEIEETATLNEWKQVALVIDRLLFWIFFTCTLATTLTLLVFVPLSSLASEIHL